MKTLSIIAAVTLTAIVLSSCSLTVDPSGARTWNIRGDEAAAAAAEFIEIHYAK